MREVESLIEESKKVIDDENEEEDFSSSDGENHVKMLNAGDPRGFAAPANQILPDVTRKRQIINSHRDKALDEEEEIEEGGQLQSNDFAGTNIEPPNYQQQQQQQQIYSHNEDELLQSQALQQPDMPMQQYEQHIDDDEDDDDEEEEQDELLDDVE